MDWQALLSTSGLFIISLLVRPVFVGVHSTATTSIRRAMKCMALTSHIIRERSTGTAYAPMRWSTVVRSVLSLSNPRKDHHALTQISMKTSIKPVSMVSFVGSITFTPAIQGISHSLYSHIHAHYFKIFNFQHSSTSSKKIPFPSCLFFCSQFISVHASLSS